MFEGLKLPGRFTLVTITLPGRIGIYMGYLQLDQVDERRRLKMRLESIPLVTIDDTKLDKFPSFPLEAIAAPGEFAKFMDALDSVLTRIQ